MPVRTDCVQAELYQATQRSCTKNLNAEMHKPSTAVEGAVTPRTAKLKGHRARPSNRRTTPLTHEGPESLGCFWHRGARGPPHWTVLQGPAPLLTKAHRVNTLTRVGFVTWQDSGQCEAAAVFPLARSLFRPGANILDVGILHKILNFCLLLK